MIYLEWVVGYLLLGYGSKKAVRHMFWGDNEMSFISEYIASFCPLLWPLVWLYLIYLLILGLLDID